MTTETLSAPVYQGQFGEFTINQSDRTSVIIYRAGLMVAALTFAIGSALVLFYNTPHTIAALTPLYLCFSLALGVSLLTIHIYMVALHRLLQIVWAIGSISALVLALSTSQPLAITVYNQPLTLFGIGFTFVALTGIFFKEAFCFNRLETKALTAIVPVLLLSHLVRILPPSGERVLLAAWAILLIVFALRKVFQAIPPDIGDKSVFAHIKAQAQTKH